MKHRFYCPLIAATACAAVCLLVGARRAQGDALDNVQRRGALVLGADQEGGGPYVFPDEKDPNVLRGFEVELAEMLAAELHVKAQFKQGQWDKAHAIVQQDETKLGCWAHGIVHLVEGDLGNARYWYRRAGRPFPKDRDVDREVAELTAALKALQ